MSNRNQTKVALAHRKELKSAHKAVKSSFGESGNLNKSPKNYQAVYKKSTNGGVQN